MARWSARLPRVRCVGRIVSNKSDGQHNREDNLMPTPEIPDRSTVPALLRAALAGDEEGAAAIVDSCEHLPLVFAVAAWANMMHGGADFASVQEYDAYLAGVQRAMREAP
jgi:hypothetical protein